MLQSLLFMIAIGVQGYEPVYYFKKWETHTIHMYNSNTGYSWEIGLDLDVMCAELPIGYKLLESYSDFYEQCNLTK